MSDITVQQRRANLEAAKVQFRRKPKAVLTMEEVAALWGVVKPAMHNLHKTIPGWPAPSEKKGNTLFYPARPIIDSLLAYLDRKVKAERTHAQAFSDLVRPAQEKQEDGPPPLTAAEQLKAYELRKRLIDEELSTGVLHRSSDCAATADKVFTIISRTFGSKLSDTLDPNGEWTPEVRASVDEAAQGVTLQCFEEMKHMLTAGAEPADADHGTTGPAKPARAGNRARPRRKAGKG